MERSHKELLSAVMALTDALQKGGMAKNPAPHSVDQNLRQLSGEAPGGREGLEKALAFYSENAMKTSNPMFMNQLWAGLSKGGVLGEFMGAALNTSMYTYEVAPVATMIELQCFELIAERAGFGPVDGTFVPGGSYGNMLGLLLGRQKWQPQVKDTGMERPLVAFVSEDAHYSFKKAANIMGLGQNNLIKVSANRRGQMDVAALKCEILKSRQMGQVPFAVAATAGTTVRASFDPIEEIGDLCQDEDLWFHVDGALGGSALFSEKHKKEHLKGLEKADSFIMNFHKLMGLPLHCSAFVTRHKGHLGATTGLDAADTSYLFHDDDAIDLGKFSLQCGRKADVLKFWMAWVEEGASGFSQRVHQIFNLASYGEAQVLENPKLKLVCPRESVTVCFQFKAFGDERDNEINKKIRDSLLADGELAINYGWVHGWLALRIVPFNSALTPSHLDGIFQKIIDRGEALLKTKT